MKRSVKKFMAARTKAFPYRHNPDTKVMPMQQIIRKRAAKALQNLRAKHGPKKVFRRMKG